LLQLVDLRLGQHPAIAHHHYSLQSKPLPQFLDLKLPARNERNTQPFAFSLFCARSRSPKDPSNPRRRCLLVSAYAPRAR
ncbi:MAG TPA: hypothetical protein VI756_26900, partial [Blastocatellia bacterium]